MSVGDTLTYEFVATNTGATDLTGVIISDPLARAVATDVCPGRPARRWLPAESMTCTATYAVTQADVNAGQIDNTATVDATDPGRATDLEHR